MESEIVDSETRVLNLNKGNYEDIRRELCLIDWGELLIGMTVDGQWQTFQERMGELHQLFIPVWHKSKMGKRPIHDLQRRLERVSDPRKKHMDCPRKIIGLKIGSCLEFNKERPRN